MNLDILEKRVIETILENGESIDETGFPKNEGTAKELIAYLYISPVVDIADILNFAEEYRVSIDWLLGRKDTSWVQ